MRKILEGALRDGDVAIVETQRLARELVLGPSPDSKATKDERAPAPGKGPLGVAETVRAATANDLADELEPGTASAPAVARKGSRKALWIALALLVIGGGGTAAALLLNKGEASYASSTRIKGYPLEDGKKVGRVLVETDGKVTPDDVGVVYANTLEELKAFEPGIGGTRDVLDEIVAIPAAALCEPSAYPGTDPPPDCGTVPATIAFGKGGSKKLLLAHDRVPLGDAMRTGVGRAVCEFQVSYADPEKQADLIDKVCEMTKRFAAAK
jgi:hypothetical protein